MAEGEGDAVIRCPSCGLNGGDRITIRYKRSAWARDHDGEEHIVFQHKVSSVLEGDFFDGKHVVILNPILGIVVWGDEVEEALREA